jgi:hypothetical protein
MPAMNEQEILDRAERAANSLVGTDDAYERLLRRRDRKRRSQRITAGIVGIAVFVAALWIVGDVASFNRTEETVVPGGSGTTRPAETGSAETGPAINGPYEYDPSADYVGLPPKGAQPSGPESSELVAGDVVFHAGWVYVFEDGRVISNSGPPMPTGTVEQRLTPEGVELVRSGAIRASDFICLDEGHGALWRRFSGCSQVPRHEIPPSAWEDSTLRPYVPYRYAIGLSDEPLGWYPMEVQDLLRGKETMFDVAWMGKKVEGFVVTTEEARTVDEILADAGFLIDIPGVTAVTHQRWVADSSDPEGMTLVSFDPILPDGTIGTMGGG